MHIRKNSGKDFKLFPKKKEKKGPPSTARDGKWLQCAHFGDKHSSMYSAKKRKNKCSILILGSLKKYD